MRSYGKNFIYKKTVNYRQRQVREATEWDVRIDVNDELTADAIVNNIKSNQDDLLFALVSGVEVPDTLEVRQGCAQPDELATWKFKGNQYGSSETHVHLCVVLRAPLCRLDVLKLVRGPRKMGDEYCAPRNPRFTYAGWVIHHAKSDWKVDGEPSIRYEFGTLPMDPFTTDAAVAIVRLLKKYPSPAMEARFKGYAKLLEHDKIKSKIEQYTMLLEDHDAK